MVFDRGEGLVDRGESRRVGVAGLVDVVDAWLVRPWQGPGGLPPAAQKRPRRVECFMPARAAGTGLLWWSVRTAPPTRCAGLL
eukprot:SAG31_NODE_683_length_12836_cov_8.304938_14_plen_83_part_00